MNALRQAAGWLVFVVAKALMLPHFTLALLLLAHNGLLQFRCVVAGHVNRTDSFFEMPDVTYCGRCGQPDDATKEMMTQVSSVANIDPEYEAMQADRGPCPPDGDCHPQHDRGGGRALRDDRWQAPPA